MLFIFMSVIHINVGFTLQIAMTDIVITITVDGANVSCRPIDPQLFDSGIGLSHRLPSHCQCNNRCDSQTDLCVQEPIE